MDECFKQRKQIAKEFKTYQKVFIALGDENRQQIFLVLLEHDKIGMRVPEITEKTHLSRPAVSHHLKILKDAGLVNMHRVGTKNYYSGVVPTGSGMRLTGADRNESAKIPFFQDRKFCFCKSNRRLLFQCEYRDCKISL